MDSQAENVVLQHKRAVQGLEHKYLGEGVRRVLVALQSSYDADDDAAVQHGLRVHRCDHSVDVLEAQTVEFFHDGSRTLELLPFESHQRRVCIVEVDHVRPRGNVVECHVVLLHELLADVLETRVHFAELCLRVFQYFLYSMLVVGRFRFQRSS